MKESSPYGSRRGTGAASLDIVISKFSKGRTFSVKELEKEVRIRGLPKRGAIPQHLYKLRRIVRRVERGWQRVK